MSHWISIKFANHNTSALYANQFLFHLMTMNYDWLYFQINNSDNLEKQKETIWKLN